MGIVGGNAALNDLFITADLFLSIFFCTSNLSISYFGFYVNFQIIFFVKKLLIFLPVCCIIISK